MQESDIGNVLRIQAEAYTDVMQESETVFRSRFLSAPGTAWVVERERSLCAYLVAYKSAPGIVSPWGSEFSHSENASALYIHDLALGVAARGLRMGQWLVEQMMVQARLLEMEAIALVSVQNSKTFWQKMGFDTCVTLNPDQQQNLDTYAGDAFYMLRKLA